jgi:hypothetical protein
MSIFAVLIFSSAQCLLGQQSATPGSLLAGALAVMGGTNVQALALTGNAEFIAGSTDDTGSFTGNCASGGSSRLSLSLSSASRTETRQIANGTQSGTWTDSNGVSHAIVPHNLYAPAAWFCPVVELSRIVSASNLNIQFIGNEEKDGATLAHFTVTSVPPGTGPEFALFTHLSQVDIFLDPQTSRPVVFDFNVHPDNNALVDIPVEIRFSDYKQVNGVWTPFTVEKYVNFTLALKLQVESAS